MLQQICYVLYSLLILPFSPFLILMAKKVRKSVPELPEASENVVAKIEGNAPEIRLLAIGESSFAGVGVTDHKDGIIGGVAQKMYDATQKTISWQVLARNGYTAERANLKLVPRIPEHAFDYVIIGLGANDTFHFNSPLTFKKNMIALVENVKKRQPLAKIVLVNMPPVRDFMAFPWILRQILGNIIDLHGAVIRTIPKKFDYVFYIDEKIVLKDWIKKTGGHLKATDFFSDGVHPSAMTYGLWGKEVGAFILEKCH
jgi:lysophospholipase L1-like esterase